ncbi:ribosome small subunit-dependent GTPase A [Haliangium ochraceum DSM 14365]|uniref:Small ribosomal subunit biogenesis GTPase RsgA n=1 Tax=Haliangium ochraceum (strain DSM 14365 / JCM 11303 / SMP-2) TaxID=502025 RepID=D0LVG1_HALO1|nr:ribosome small subunit-dependent GTPase A [Haliangium ochraceum DSM 14365]
MTGAAVSTPLDTLGWGPFFAAQHRQLDDPTLVCARVAIEYQDRYHLLGAEGPLWAQLSGGMLRAAKRERQRRPAVGDWVAVQPAVGDGMGTVVHLFDRRTRFLRQAAGRRPVVQVVAANIDAAFIVTAFGHDFNPRRLERYLTCVGESGARAVLVLNKRDQAADEDEIAARIAEVRAVAAGAPVLCTSATEGRGLDELRAEIASHETAALVGSSGVGKSSLVNWLMAAEVQRTAPVRERDGRGRHTTTHRELMLLPGGGLLIDTPGMRELQLFSAADALREAFADIASLSESCRFRDCRHRDEPGCEVRQALHRGRLARERYEGFCKLQGELEAAGARFSQ